MKTEIQLLEAAIIPIIQQFRQSHNSVDIHMILRYFCTNTLATLIREYQHIYPAQEYINSIKKELTEHPALRDTAVTQKLPENVIQWKPNKSRSAS